MKFTADRVNLLKVLTIVNVAIGQKSPTPAFLNFKLTMTDEGLQVLGSDNDLTITSVLPIKDGDKELRGLPSERLLIPTWGQLKGSKRKY